MFEIAATTIFAVGAVVWNKSDWLNVFIKIVFFGLAAWGGFEVLVANGYLIKTN